MNYSTEKLPEAVPSVDRISNFPDEILCRILSFLKTKQAMATSILSKRWQFLWTYLDTLEIKGIHESKLQFAQIVNRALQHHRGLIKSMCLVCYGRVYNNDDIVKWIQTAISKKVETLHLCFFDYTYKWPLRLFNSQTLVELKLEHANITYTNIPSAPLFPKLKKLHLIQTFCKTDVLNRFISLCPILEYFNLKWNVMYDYVEGYYISSATLKKVLYNCSSLHFDNLKIVLNTPALEVLEFHSSKNSELVIESSMPSLHKAEILIHSSYSSSSLKGLEFLSNVSKLCCKVQEDRFNPRSLNKLNLHANFNNLTRLEIIDRWIGLDVLRIFIEKSNNLKAITLRNRIVFKKSGVIWEEPQHVPKCFLSSLRSVSIYGYHKEGEEIDLMIKYILGNAKVLKQLNIRKRFPMTDYEFKLRMLKKISMFPKASERCEISVKI